MKSKKFTLEKFRIAKLDNLAKVKGGTNGPTDPSLDTTNTTDPNVPCPNPTTNNNGNTTTTGTTNDDIPSATSANDNNHLTVP